MTKANAKGIVVNGIEFAIRLRMSIIGLLVKEKHKAVGESRYPKVSFSLGAAK